MLSRTYLEQLATKYQTTDVNIRREYAQHLFLSYIFREHESASLFFKGGTALRLAFRSPRFSEDLDFDATIRDRKVWEAVVEQALLEISREGVAVDVDESKTTSGGYLGIIRMFDKSESVVIHLEFSFRKGKAAGEVVTIANDCIPAYPVRILATPDLVEGKMKALFDRKKARDFYDLYFMLRANMLDNKQKTKLKDVMQLLKKKEYAFNRELSLFLPRSQTLVIKDFKTTLTREIQRAL